MANLKLASCYIQLNTSTLNYTLPDHGARYTLIAQGNGCWVKAGDASLSGLTSANAAAFIPEGQILRTRIHGAYLGAFAASAAGKLWIISSDDD